MVPIITSREEWGAMPPKEQPRMLVHPIENVVIFPECQMEPCKTKKSCIKAMKKLQKKHMIVRGLPDIKFNFLIGMDGRVYEGTGWNHRSHGVQVSEYPELDQCISICFIGDFAGWDPPAEMIETTDDFIEDAIKKNYIVKNYQEMFDAYD